MTVDTISSTIFESASLLTPAKCFVRAADLPLRDLRSTLSAVLSRSDGRLGTRRAFSVELVSGLDWEFAIPQHQNEIESQRPYIAPRSQLVLLDRPLSTEVAKRGLRCKDQALKGMRS